jgi:hypothetical protein
MDFKEGLYALYYTGQHGSGVILAIIKSGRFVGIDALGGKLNGQYQAIDAGLQMNLAYTFSPGPLVTGQVLSNETTLKSVPLITYGMLRGEITRMDIGTGPVNVRAEFLHEPI